MLGYHIEVSARHADRLMAPDSGFTHRQTLAGVVRFNSPDLHAEASRVVEAGAHALAAEAAHFEELTALAVAAAPRIAATADAIARIDVAASHAARAAEGGWCLPHLTEQPCLELEAARHPVVEEALARDGERFVANDCALGPNDRLWLITGPNMGGKSTFLRQVAIAALLAQAGSYVPAARAKIGIVDRLFSRVGAADNLARGRSTFMVEMVETAAILAQATPSSLVILDEIGRGTSTYDGLAIAWAVVEAMHDEVRARTLFATHYHELTRLADRLEALSLHHVRAREWKGELVLLHEVGDGPADRSYGIAVAKLAGLAAAGAGPGQGGAGQARGGPRRHRRDRRRARRSAAVRQPAGRSAGVRPAGRGDRRHRPRRADAARGAGGALRAEEARRARADAPAAALCADRRPARDHRPPRVGRAAAAALPTEDLRDRGDDAAPYARSTRAERRSRAALPPSRAAAGSSPPPIASSPTRSSASPTTW